MSFEDGLSRKPPDDFLTDDCLLPAFRFDSLLLFESGNSKEGHEDVDTWGGNEKR